jgi:hypothetical protein
LDSQTLDSRGGSVRRGQFPTSRFNGHRQLVNTSDHSGLCCFGAYFPSGRRSTRNPESRAHGPSRADYPAV